MAESNQTQVLIIGAGSAGICMGVQLKKAGIDDFVVLEKGTGVGGTWHWNRYPGAECDVQSHLYSFSFEQKNDWSRPFAGQEEILDYLNSIADKYGLRPHIRHNEQVAALSWEEENARWCVETKAGETLYANVVVSAIGMFNDIVWPEIDGLHDFEGTYFHSARWNHDHDLSGERVGVVGIAASAIQFVPEIARKVSELHLYQRTANWVVPKPNTPYTAQELEAFIEDPSKVKKSRDEIYDVWNTLATFGDKAVLAEIERSGLERLAEVNDPEVRRKLTPDHPFGCKRPLFSDLYYPTFNRDNVELITEDIAQVSASGIHTVDGGFRELDTIIYSTGFYTTRYLATMDVTGRRGVSIEDAWSDGAQAYLGMNTSGFPNLFMLYGPNTNQGCILFMLERQCDYVMRQLHRLQDENLSWMDIRPEVMNAFNQKIQDDINRVEVWQANCGHDFYYRAGPNRRFVTQWPHSMDDFTEATTAPDRENFEVEKSA